jgi:NADH-quinone oxidoreductase subunit M
VILSAVYMLWMFQRVYYGAVTNGENRDLPDLRPHEWSSVVPLCAVALVMGVFPSVFLAPMEPAVTRVVERMQNTRTLRVQVRDDMQKAKFKLQMQPTVQTPPTPQTLQTVTTAHEYDASPVSSR